MAARTPSGAEPSLGSDVLSEIIFWQSIQGTQNPDDVRVYLEQFPNGQFSRLARNWLRALEAKTEPRPDLPAEPDAQPGPKDPFTELRGERRRALVIGNGGYSGAISKLTNPPHDAEDVASALREAGFEVTLRQDLDREAMLRSIVDLGRDIRAGGVGLFYYAGHAVQLLGKNYMIPIGAEIDVEDYVPLETVDLDEVLGRMGGAHNRLNIVILDACRDNPFARSFRSISRGLAQMLAPAGTFIAYATAPGDVAADGTGRNSPFPGALVEMLDEPGLRIEDVFKRVTLNVRERSDGKQNPWVHSSIVGDFYFRLPEPLAKTPPEETPPAMLADRPDYLAWMAIQGSREAMDFKTFIQTFPKSALVPFARSRLRALGAE
ncbi:MAG TPA: caspase family protein [Geminicoccaceae bacterium]|nr:caspase family protein [Geminicoccaceae bacterium]